MVTTRSKEANRHFQLCLIPTDKGKRAVATSSKAGSTARPHRGSARSRDLPPPNQSRTSDGESSADDDDDESADESSEEEHDSDVEDSETSSDDEFVSPAWVAKDAGLERAMDECVSYIRERTPTLRNILSTPLRLRDRARLLELFGVFTETMPGSEERMELREMLCNLWKRAREEYDAFRKHEASIKAFEEESSSTTLVALQLRILNLQTTMENKMSIYRKYVELCERDQQDEEYFKLKQWIQWAVQLPFDTLTQIPATSSHTVLLKQIQAHLDIELYGMKDVKEQILLFLHTKFLNPEVKGCCLGLVGDCGVGKTSIARSLASVLHFPFEQISFGGVHHVDSLKGFDFTYVGSQPGEVVKSLIRMKSKNGILFLDEFEKISSHAEMSSFLLHLTDFSQNHIYRDNYFTELSIDLSCLWFIYSMNNLPEERALRDRIFAIKVPGYSERDKIQILLNYLLPKTLRAHGLSVEKDLVIPLPVAQAMVRRLSPSEKGVRTLEQMARAVVSRVSFLMHHTDQITVSFAYRVPVERPVTMTLAMLDKLLEDWERNRTPDHSSAHMFV